MSREGCMCPSCCEQRARAYAARDCTRRRSAPDDELDVSAPPDELDGRAVPAPGDGDVEARGAHAHVVQLDVAQPGRQLRIDEREAARERVGLEAEHRREELERAARRPRLRRAGDGIRDRSEQTTSELEPHSFTSYAG